MATSDEELEQKRQRISELRTEIAETEEEKAREIREKDNEVEARILDREVARLESQLAQIKGTPAPVEAPNLNGGNTEVVETKPSPTTHQTPVPGEKNAENSQTANPAKN